MACCTDLGLHKTTGKAIPRWDMANERVDQIGYTVCALKSVIQRVWTETEMSQQK